MNDENQELQEAAVAAPRPTFFEALRHLINSYSVENGSNTQDTVLTVFLMNCLDAFNAAVNHRAILSNKLHELPERVRKEYEENDFAQKETKRLDLLACSIIPRFGTDFEQLFINCNSRRYVVEHEDTIPPDGKSDCSVVGGKEPFSAYYNDRNKKLLNWFSTWYALHVTDPLDDPSRTCVEEALSNDFDKLSCEDKDLLNEVTRIIRLAKCGTNALLCCESCGARARVYLEKCEKCASPETIVQETTIDRLSKKVRELEGQVLALSNTANNYWMEKVNLVVQILKIDKFKAIDLLQGKINNTYDKKEDSYPIEKVDEEIRKAGGDPEAIGTRGEEEVQKILERHKKFMRGDESGTIPLEEAFGIMDKEAEKKVREQNKTVNNEAIVLDLQQIKDLQERGIDLMSLIQEAHRRKVADSVGECMNKVGLVEADKNDQ